MAAKCAGCGTTEGVPAYRLCGPCLHEATVASRAAQGLPEKVEDPLVCRRVAVLLGAGQARGDAA